MKKTLVLKGSLPTLGYFADAMCIEKGIVVDLSKPSQAEFLKEALKEGNIEVITFNNYAVNLEYTDGTNIWDKNGVKITNILVDHPINYLTEILLNPNRFRAVYCVDREHAEFLKVFLPEFESIFRFLPHGGVEKPKAEKDIDVLYVGSFTASEKFEYPDIPGVNSADFYSYVRMLYKQNSLIEAHDAAGAYMRYFGCRDNLRTYATLCMAALTTVEKEFTSRRRRNMIEALLKHGIRVHVAGTNVWNELSKQYSNMVYYGEISPESCMELICRAKVLINDLPYFSDGAHERIFNGMLNQAVVVTNKSRYLQSRFEDGKDIVFWDGLNYSDFVNRVSELISDDEKRFEISESAYRKTQGDKWKNRMEEIE